MRVLTVMGLAVTLGACSSIVEGTSQEIMVNTNPSGASCVLNRQGAEIARIPSTPAATTIKKTKYDITVVCAKAGFEDASFFNKSDVAGATLGNIILGGGIGWIVDSASGADNKYTSPINITLVPVMPVNPAIVPAPVSAQPPVVAAPVT